MSSRSRPFWGKTGALTTTPSVILLPNGWSELKVLVSAQSYGATGATYVAPAVASVNGVITISSGGTPTGGTWFAKVFPVPTAGGYEAPGTGALAVTTAIPYNETAANIKTALVATGYFATGDITAAGGALPTDVSLTWTGAYAGTVPLLDINSTALTGGVNARIYARTTTLAAGNGGYGYLEANTQEIWDADQFGTNKNDRYVYLAAVTGTANFWLSAYA